MKKILVLTTLTLVTLSGCTLFQVPPVVGTTTTSVGTSSTPTVVPSPESEFLRYVEYSPVAFQQAAGKKRVYFFHAPWCPTCITVNAVFEANMKDIPADVVVFKTNYDNSDELKKKYAITYQHTFVYVDEAGAELKKWNGGGITELISNTQ